MRFFRRSRSRRNSRGFRGAAPKSQKVATPIEAMRLHAPQKQKTRMLNTLGRLEAFEVSRTVPDKSFNDYENKNITEKREFLKPMMRIDYDKPEKLVFKKDSEICRERQRRRDEILKKTGGKGLRVKNALWNYTSYIQCK